MPGRLLLGMQGPEWGAPQLHSYAHGPYMQPEAGPWTMMGPPAQDNLFARSAPNRRFFSESMEYTQEVRGTPVTDSCCCPTGLSTLRAL